MVHPRTPTLARIHARAKQQGGGSVSNKSRRLETSFTGPYLSASFSTPIDLHFLASVALTNEVHMAYISSHTCMDSFIHPENVAKKNVGVNICITNPTTPRMWVGAHKVTPISFPDTEKPRHPFISCQHRVLHTNNP